MHCFNDILKMEVINLFDGRRVGYVSDVAADFHTGKLEGIIIYGPGSLFKKYDHKKDTLIPYNKIVSVGDDLIIVDLDDESVLKLN